MFILLSFTGKRHLYLHFHQCLARIGTQQMPIRKRTLTGREKQVRSGVKVMGKEREGKGGRKAVTSFLININKTE